MIARTQFHTSGAPAFEFYEMDGHSWVQIHDEERDSALTIFVDTEYSDRLKRAAQAFNAIMSEQPVAAAAE